MDWTPEGEDLPRQGFHAEKKQGENPSPAKQEGPRGHSINHKRKKGKERDVKHPQTEKGGWTERPPRRQESARGEFRKRNNAKNRVIDSGKHKQRQRTDEGILPARKGPKPVVGGR